MPRTRIRADKSVRAVLEKTGLGFPACSRRERERLFAKLANVPEDRWFEVMRIGFTQFFRHKDQLDTFRKKLLPVLLKRKAISILSLPCSSGEEVYTLAMILEAEGVSKYRVTGIDLDPEKLLRAKTGLYPRAQVMREIPARYRSRSMKALGGRGSEWFRPSSEIARNTRFSRQNILKLDGRTGPVDVVFCRNLFHFFSPEVTRKALARIRRILRRGGYLIISPVDKMPSSNRWVKVAPCVYQAH